VISVAPDARAPLTVPRESAQKQFPQFYQTARSILDFRLAIFDLLCDFADARAPDAKDGVAFLQIAARMKVAWPRRIDIDDFLNGRRSIAHHERSATV